MGRGRRRGFVQSRMGPVCFTKKSLKLLQCVRKDTSLFAHDVDEFWGAGCSLGNLQPPLCDAQPQAMLPARELRAAQGAALCPTDAMGCWESPLKPFSMREHRRWQAWTAPCRRAALPPGTGERLVLPHLQRQQPQRRRVRAVLVQLSADQAHFSGSCLFPLCFH